MDGVLVIDKPRGPTSHDMVAAARRALGTRRIGHTGTLDPLATGVLPLVVGQATRLSQFLTGAPKGYDATVRLGVETDTFDAAGQPVRTAPEGQVLAVSDADILAALEPFRGAFEQAPPPYSAKKVRGVRAYELARRQEPVDTSPVPVAVQGLEMIEREGSRVRLRVEASAGFYVRSLARDLGQRLGCGAHLETLQRYRSGAFTMADAVTLAELESGGRAGALSRLIGMERLLPDLPAFDLSERGAHRASHGNTLGPMDGRPREGRIPPAGGLARVFSADGRLVAVARTAAGGVLQPLVVLG
ncbi:MAG TPA: tRNA pseudouridine(55) synthase TruB [Vicinamibacterales bacterium]|nr:tRNA pseudouridine(55) synthase TruB [Vicinamibacterales bacterium]